MIPTTLASEHAVARNWLLGGLLVLAILSILVIAAPVMIPIFMAIFLAAVMRVPMRALQRLGLPQLLAATTVFLASLFGTGTLIAFLYAPAAQWVGELPSLATRIEHWIVPLRETVEQAQSTADTLEHVTDLSPEASQPVVVQEPSFVERAFTTSRVLLAQVAVTIVLSLFLLAHPAPLLPLSLIERLGTRGHRIRTSLSEIEGQMSRYMGAMAMINAGVGVCTTIAMLVLGMPSPVLWGVIAALLGFIPYLGPLLTAAIIGSVALLTFDTWPEILAPPAVYLVIIVLESELVTPMVIGRVMTLHPVAVFLFVLIWSWMWGLAGSFLAVPILVASVITVRNLFIEGDQTLSDFMLTAGGIPLTAPAPATGTQTPLASATNREPAGPT